MHPTKITVTIKIPVLETEGCMCGHTELFGWGCSAYIHADHLWIPIKIPVLETEGFFFINT